MRKLMGMTGVLIASIAVTGILIASIGATPKAPVVGVVDAATAAGNRQWIESQTGVVNMPVGLVMTDRAVRLASGVELRGAGAGLSAIRNGFCSAPFGDNCTLQILNGVDAGLGYADGCTVNGAGVTLNDPSVVTNYAIGSVCWSWKWNGYDPSLGGQTRVRIHRVLDRPPSKLVLDSPPDLQANAINWTHEAVRVAAQEGQLVLAGVPGNWLGRWVLVTGGPTIANECVGEIRRIVAPAAGGMRMNRPLRRSWGATAAAVLYSPVVNVAVSDLTIAAPVNPQSVPFFAQHALGVKIARCVVQGDVQFALSAEVLLRDDRLDESINLNATADALVQNCRARHGYVEEGCSDLDFDSCLFSGSRVGGFLSNGYAPSERLRIRHSLIEAAQDMPLNIGGRECVLDGVRVQGSQPVVGYVASYLAGDRLRVAGLISDTNTVIRSGGSVSLFQVRGRLTLGWVTGEPSPIGNCTDCDSVNANFLSPAAKAQWAFTASNVSQGVTMSAPQTQKLGHPVKIALAKPDSVR